MTRLAVARLWFYANSFAPTRTDLATMRASEWTDDPAALVDTGNGSALSGVARFVAQRPAWDATLLRSASAPPGGPLTAETFAAWLSDVEVRLQQGGFDGVFLSLHGACQAEGDPQADVTIMRRVRAIMGRRPVVASLDMHANLSDETVLLLDGASANRVWPHGGEDAAATRALKLLEGIVEQRCRPVGAIARVPRESNVDADEQDAQPDVAAPGRNIVDASVFWGFPWADMPHGGSCAMVWADRDLPAARETAHLLARRIHRWWPQSVPNAGPDDTTLARALVAAAGPFPRPVAQQRRDDPPAQVAERARAAHSSAPELRPAQFL